MKPRKLSRKRILSLCDSPGPDDGLDPRYDARATPERRASRKAQQLCAQAARTLHILLGECGDDALRELTLLTVEPAPHAGRLLVTVGPVAAEQVQAVLERLHRVAGRFRSEVAAAVNRRRAPELVFRAAVR